MFNVPHLILSIVVKFSELAFIFMSSMLSITTGSLGFQVLGEQTNTLVPYPHCKPKGHLGREQDQHVLVCSAHHELPEYP
jgi:hypothetical protein